MANRYALIIGSRKKINSTNPYLDESLVEKSRIEFKSIISTENIGKYAFSGWSGENKSEPEMLLTPTTTKITTLFNIDNISPEPDDTLLIYYFGHGIINDEGNFCIAFMDLDLTNSRHYTLDHIVSNAHRVGFRKMILVIDSCHSGAAEITFNGYDNIQYFVLSASTNGYAHFNNSGGVFTQALAECLRYPHIENVYDQVNETITFERWFDAAVEKLKRNQNKQIPFSGGTLGNEELIPYDNDKLRTPGYNSKVPIQSIYQKLYDLLNLFRTEPNNDNSFISGSTTFLYEKLAITNNRSFLFYRVVEGVSRGEFIRIDRFEYYLELCNKLNLVRKNSNQNWEIRPEGIKAIVSRGEEFNTVIVHYILYWMLGVTIELSLDEMNRINLAKQRTSINNLVQDQKDNRKELRKHIKKTLKSLVDTGKVPNLHHIYTEFYHSDVHCLPKNDLKVALRLLSYTEVLKKADSDTYFY